MCNFDKCQAEQKEIEGQTESYVHFFQVLNQAENWQRLYNDTRSLFPVVLEQLDDYNAKFSDIQESLDQALNRVRDAEDMNRVIAARQRDHEVQCTVIINACREYFKKEGTIYSKVLIFKYAYYLNVFNFSTDMCNIVCACK